MRFLDVQYNASDKVDRRIIVMVHYQFGVHVSFPLSEIWYVQLYGRVCIRDKGKVRFHLTFDRLAW